MAFLLLDSSVIFDVLKARFGRAEFLAKLVDQGFVLACCPVNITEVYAGLRPGEEPKTSTLLTSLECLPVTPEIAQRAGLLKRDWQRIGHTLSYTDVTIAAVALANGTPLLTDNRKHFPMPRSTSLANARETLKGRCWDPAVT